MPDHNAPPRDTTGWIDVRGDGGVLKRIIREGNPAAGLPINGMCAKVNYDAWIEGGWFHGRKVDTSRDRPEEDGDYQFLIGDENEAVKDGWVIRGLNAGGETMHRGERAEFIFSPEYAYGHKGSKSRPKVPPNATLRFEVDMLTWKPALSDEANVLELPWWERLELAHATKESANEHYREGQPEEARMRYWKAGMLMDVIGNPGTDVEMPADRIDEQNALAVTCWLNEAQCYIKMAQNEEVTGKNYKGSSVTSATNPTLWRKAIESAEIALKLDPENVKAHYRKGLAYQALHEFNAAREMFEFAQRHQPASKEIREALERTKELRLAATDDEKKTYQKIITKSGKSGGLYSDAPDVSDGGAAAQRRVAHAPNPTVWLSFSMGGEPVGDRVEIELWADKLPKTAENFRALCTGEKGLHYLTRTPMCYRGSPIHRVINGFMIQGGDFVARDGTGGESVYGGYFADEGFHTRHDQPGLIAMANSGRDTNRSQFYITTARAAHLDGRHVVFGQVRSGMATVENIAAAPTTDGEKPTVEIAIDDCGETTPQPAAAR